MSSGTGIHKGAMQTYGLGSRPAHVWGTWPPTTSINQSGGAQTPRSMVRAIVIDDHARARRDVRWELRLETDLDVVGEARTGAQGVALAQDLHPDIVVMDEDMPDMDGIQAAERLHALAPDCLLILLTRRDNPDMHGRALAAGASVILEKGNPAIFRASLHDLVQHVKARNTPAWPEGDTAHAPTGEGSVDEGPTGEEPISEGNEQG